MNRNESEDKIAILSLVFGLLSIIGPCAIAAVVLGIIAITSKKCQEKGYAIFGLILGVVGCLFGIFMTWVHYTLY